MTLSSTTIDAARNRAPSAAMGRAPMPQAMPSPISRNSTVTSLGSSTGVRKRMMPAAPAMPNARASELPMMIDDERPRYRQQHLGLLHRPVHRPVALVQLLDTGDEDGDHGRRQQLDQLGERIAPRRRPQHRGGTVRAQAARGRVEGVRGVPDEADAGNDQAGADAGADDAGLAPIDGHAPRLGDRVVHAQHGVEPGQLEELAGAFGGTRDPERAADPPRTRMCTHERANARAVDRGDPIEIGDEPPITLTEEPLH